MPNISIDYEAVKERIDALKTEILIEQLEMESLYEDVAQTIEEYEGEQAEALREMAQAEKIMMLEVCDFIQKFEDSIQFIVNEMQHLDETGAGCIASQERGYR